MIKRKTFLQKHSSFLIIGFIFALVGIASAAYISPSEKPELAPILTTENEHISVYRPSKKDWINVSLDKLKPLDFLVKHGQAYHITARPDPRTGNLPAIPLGKTSYDILEGHNSAFDPEDESYPQSDKELVYAKWDDTDLWTYQPLARLKNGDLFLHNGREFTIRVSVNGLREVKPTSNVLSRIKGVWSEHHDNQIHLTLSFPQIAQTNKIITTHEHPFYVPTTGEWVPAGDLKVGMALHTCDGTPAEVAAWEFVNEPFTAWNIEVEYTNNYYVSDPDNPDAPPVLVHNDCAPSDLIANGGKQLDNDTIIGIYGNKFVKQADGSYINVGAASSLEIIESGINVKPSAPIKITKSKFGHTFDKHGADNTDFLINRARGSGNSQGQFLDNQAAAKFIQNNLHKLSNGSIELPMPTGFRARVINPDGTFSPATKIVLVPGRDGVKTAYPIR